MIWFVVLCTITNEEQRRNMRGGRGLGENCLAMQCPHSNGESHPRK